MTDGQPVCGPLSQLFTESSSQSVNQSATHLASQPASQSVSQSVSHTKESVYQGEIETSSASLESLLLVLRLFYIQTSYDMKTMEPQVH